MLLFYRYTLFTACVLFFSTSYAQTNIDEKVDQYTQLMNLNALTLDIDNIIQAQLDEKTIMMDNSAELTSLKEAIKRSLSSKRAQFYYKEYIKEHLSIDTLTDVINFYSSPEVQEMINFDNKVYTTNQQIEKAKFEKQFDIKTVDDDKLELCVMLYQDLNIGGSMISLMKNSIYGVHVGLNSSEIIELKTSEEEVNSQINMIFDHNFSYLLKNDLLKDLLFTYRNVNNYTLRRHTELWSSDIGTYSIQLSSNALDYAFDKMNKDLENHKNL
ncbi:DUF2059 domain-containing protein [Flammeovirga kamogawensis]|uniref:DUF2059 domain-containing protein n=1 Tax=Flammeovirga kamogawensis TaxID=373891 RepID=A0ABX8GY63_9BACT|nr:hypothetical protein [Flammeovirga kamogawensis]MBB6461308.1 hypothetical protein [Flammeovirga kamogawensis]QWG07865.1 hypothetical protein KM029_02680 [Flammeovirga kamogawensis]TRX69672.1 hypothetical protein EO216_16615 [Flammeovirga kamogawensis]